MPILSIKVENLKEFKESIKEAPALAERYLNENTKKAGIMVQSIEKKEAPVDKAQLRRTIDMSYRPITATVGPTVEYAKFVVKGTRPHLITPRRAKALRYKTRTGQWVFAKRVRHPGTRANDFVGRAYLKSIKPVTRLFSKMVENFLNNITVQ